MNSYIENLNSYHNAIVYDFDEKNGGLGDFFKFFMIILQECMNSKMRFYYKIKNIGIEKYIKLKYSCMYIKENEILNLKNVAIKQPKQYYYKNDIYAGNLRLNEVFYFNNEVKLNVNTILPSVPKEYISIHLRLGDRFLETDKKYILCKRDKRVYSERKLFAFIEQNIDKNILFFFVIITNINAKSKKNITTLP